MPGTELPWHSLPAASERGTASGKRVNSNGRYEFFWGRDSEGNPLLILSHLCAKVPRSLPSLHGLQVRHDPAAANQRRSLVWVLKRPEHTELFHELCLDIIRVAEGCLSEEAAVGTAVGRTWRWHSLLRGAGNRRLSIRRQMGLIAELWVLAEVLVPKLGPVAAVKAWRGPLDEAKDFRHANVAVEVKATTEASGQVVSISSEFQLDADGLNALWLVVARLKESDGHDDGDSFTLNSLVAEAMEATSGEPAATQLLEGLLMAAGYEQLDDYDQPRWILEQMDFYSVETGFPAITPSTLPDGVSGVRYSVRLAECLPYQQARTLLEASLAGATHGGH